MVENMEIIYNQVHHNIEEANRKYKIKADKHIRHKAPIKEGDMVWIHIRLERFPQVRNNKLMPRVIGPFPVLRQYGSNTF